MDKCSGITNLTVTQEMLNEYPELEGRGFEVGDNIDIGIPYDGKVNGPEKKIGTCEDICTTKAPTADGENGELWEAAFINEYFPQELGKLENKKSPNNCYREPVINYTKGIVMNYTDKPQEVNTALNNFMEGKAGVEELKFLKTSIVEIIPEAKEEGELTKPIEAALKVIDEEITKKPAEKVTAYNYK